MSIRNRRGAPRGLLYSKVGSLVSLTSHGPKVEIVARAMNLSAEHFGGFLIRAMSEAYNRGATRIVIEAYVTQESKGIFEQIKKVSKEGYKAQVTSDNVELVPGVQATKIVMDIPIPFR